jgi:hypothetical protein
LVSPDDPTVIIPAPPGWNPQAVLAGCYPAIAQLCRKILPEIRTIEARLDGEEANGHDTRRLRQAIGELHWRLRYTGNAAAAVAAFERVRAFGSLSPQPAIPARDEQGSFGIGTDVWFLKLDASVDAMLADDFDAAGIGPRFLDRVNNPGRLNAYLDGLLVSRLAEDGIDHRKELNFATASLVRLVLRRRPMGYPWDPRLGTVIRQFVTRWQDATTGFFGADYEYDGRRWRTVDLSLTFHMARYLEGGIGHWPQLIDTLLEIRDHRYPNGWLDDEGMTNHNNYDVAVLFGLGWQHMRVDQRASGQQELDRLLCWCLDSAIAPDGTITARAAGESLADSYYFTIAFLDTVGFFDPAKRFWTDREFRQAPALRASLERRVLDLHRSNPMARLALDRLRR